MATNNYHKSKDDKEYFSVYTLSCPITKQVKYVGKTNNLIKGKTANALIAAYILKLAK